MALRCSQAHINAVAVLSACSTEGRTTSWKWVQNYATCGIQQKQATAEIITDASQCLSVIYRHFRQLSLNSGHIKSIFTSVIGLKVQLQHPVHTYLNSVIATAKCTFGVNDKGCDPDVECTAWIREHYVFLLDNLDSWDSGLVGYLYQFSVVDRAERDDVRTERTSAKQAERLLSILGRKSPEKIEQFYVALDWTGQTHIRRTISRNQTPSTQLHCYSNVLISILSDSV